ncbi:spore gernimation protein GerC [Bacillus cereus]|nr:spore gernimation protein GerC [Bacillus cereus]
MNNNNNNNKGKTIADAISNLQEKIPREVFWGHTKVIVIGEKLAKAGIHESLDFLARTPQTRLRSNVFVSKGKAKDIMALLPPLENSSSEVLRELAVSKVLMDITLKDVLQMLSGDAQAAAVPMITINPAAKGLKPLQTISYINQTAIFKKDKMIGQINDKLTRGALWIRKEIKQATITIKSKEGNGEVSFTLRRATTELIPKIRYEKWHMKIKVIAEYDMLLNGTNLDLATPKFTQMLQKDLEKVQKVQKADILGFSEEFHRKYPQVWKKAKKDWDEIFPSVEVIFDMKATIQRSGQSTIPQGLPEDEVKKK